jgi:hypothetical protein
VSNTSAWSGIVCQTHRHDLVRLVKHIGMMEIGSQTHRHNQEANNHDRESSTSTWSWKGGKHTGIIWAKHLGMILVGCQIVIYLQD